MLARRIVLFLTCATLTAAVQAQALPTATRTLTLELGVGVSIASSDYAPGTIKGYSIFGAADLRNGLGFDIEYHDTELFTPHDIGESTVMAGLRYGRRERRFYPYVKALGGRGIFTTQQGDYATTTSTPYRAFALGGGLEYHASRSVTIRLVDAEFQNWTTFKPNGLSPVVYTFGAAYRY
jgi:opacity protein-like surface antigen